MACAGAPGDLNMKTVFNYYPRLDRGANDFGHPEPKLLSLTT